MSRILPSDPRFESARPRPVRSDLGTLLWIGGRDSRFFSDAYRYSDSQVSQIAYRQNLSEALRRPAAGVNAIISCHVNDSAGERQTFNALRTKHSFAMRLLLLSPLCVGQRPHPSDLYDSPCAYWNEWEQYLPNHLIRCGSIRAPTRDPRSVAVVASNGENASSLLAIADSGNVPSVWCIPEDIGNLQNIDQYWWDDSATRSGDWHSRLSKCQNPSADHVWLTSLLTPSEKRRALDAGVRQVLSKPGDLTSLLCRTHSDWTTSRRFDAVSQLPDQNSAHQNNADLRAA